MSPPRTLAPKYLVEYNKEQAIRYDEIARMQDVIHYNVKTIRSIFIKYLEIVDRNIKESGAPPMLAKMQALNIRELSNLKSKTKKIATIMLTGKALLMAEKSDFMSKTSRFRHILGKYMKDIRVAKSLLEANKGIAAFIISQKLSKKTTYSTAVSHYSQLVKRFKNLSNLEFSEQPFVPKKKKATKPPAQRRARSLSEATKPPAQKRARLPSEGTIAAARTLMAFSERVRIRNF